MLETLLHSNRFVARQSFCTERGIMLTQRLHATYHKRHGVVRAAHQECAVVSDVDLEWSALYIDPRATRDRAALRHQQYILHHVLSDGTVVVRRPVGPQDRVAAAARRGRRHQRVAVEVDVDVDVSGRERRALLFLLPPFSIESRPKRGSPTTTGGSQPFVCSSADSFSSSPSNADDTTATCLYLHVGQSGGCTAQKSGRLLNSGSWESIY